MELFLIVFVCYFAGSIPFGLILTKIFLKKDIREIGSGNIGATNVLRTGNKLIGYITLLLDILKAVIPILFIKMLAIFPTLLESTVWSWRSKWKSMLVSLKIIEKGSLFFIGCDRFIIYI